MVSDSLLRRPGVESFLRYLENSGKESIDPLFEKTAYRYPVAEEFFGEDAETVLENLAELGIFEKRLMDAAMMCPDCGTIAQVVKPVCPTCSSGRLVKGNVIEHMLCGYVDFEQEFYKQGFKCIKCGKELKTLGVDYRRAGVFYKCMSCGRVSAIPVKRFICGHCGRASTEEELQLKPVFSYVVVREKFAVLKGIFLDLTPIISLIESKGFVVESPAKVAGLSGVVHEFTLFASRPGAPASSSLAIDIARDADDNKLFEFFTKTFDVKAGASLLLCLGHVDEKAKKLADTFNIQMLTFTSPDELVEKSKTEIEKILDKLSKKDLYEEASYLENLLNKLGKV
ncbi:hypothetical protein CSUB_C0103 [Candidatus Caldarchaeum subterraneum]|uniref:Thaumarchaeal output domain-containing protein n=1 Tax=Caldiarchaeum subterraneum TaxID=311458 RepID=E6N4C0_CALS0|nr:hypothetical protein HGMM_F35A09C25 [Candidatus Caldarchaeum subterraneum]BAJ49966.1 hypothetical protein CSUB_C0103 [Candidatus Caldarchaeum subterraneum]